MGNPVNPPEIYVGDERNVSEHSDLNKYIPNTKRPVATFVKSDASGTRTLPATDIESRIESLRVRIDSLKAFVSDLWSRPPMEHSDADWEGYNLYWDIFVKDKLAELRPRWNFAFPVDPVTTDTYRDVSEYDLVGTQTITIRQNILEKTGYNYITYTVNGATLDSGFVTVSSAPIFDLMTPGGTTQVSGTLTTYDQYHWDGDDWLITTTGSDVTWPNGEPGLTTKTVTTGTTKNTTTTVTTTTSGTTTTTT